MVSRSRPHDDAAHALPTQAAGPAPVRTGEPFAIPVEEHAALLEALARGVPEVEAEAGGLLRQMTRHVLATPGKLLRPLLMLDACRAAGGDPQLAFPAAVGTEFGHLASLIHDDIIDGDHERRGQPTVHVKYGIAPALLTGDLLLFHMFRCYVECRERGADPGRVLDAIETLSTTCIDMCRGQALEAMLTGRLDTTEQEYLEMIGLKTAVAYRAAARIGACLGGAPPEAIEAVGGYGYNVGMAFQIVDDLFTFEGQAAMVGKPLDSDLRNGRVTLPLIYALQAGGPEAREQLAAALGVRPAGADEGRPETGAPNGAAWLGDNGTGYAQLVRLLEETGALARARARAARFTEEAKRQLDRLAPSEARERLRALADSLLERQR
jgi:geranylgeranyl diphosphate synthase type I